LPVLREPSISAWNSRVENKTLQKLLNCYNELNLKRNANRREKMNLTDRQISLLVSKYNKLSGSSALRVKEKNMIFVDGKLLYQNQAINKMQNFFK
jgi:uridine kinase